jgi:transposase-like protein
MTLTTLTMERAHDAAMDRDATLPERPVRRTFSAAYKLATLTEYEAATEDGAKGAILRREGLYSSHISEWRRARDTGALAGLDPRPRARSPEQRELARVRRRAERAEAELAKARLVIDIQGKASELLERLQAEGDEDQRQPR